MDDLITRKQHKDFAAKVDERLDALEAAKITALNITLSDSGWTGNSGDTDYPYRYVLTVTGVTTASRADAIFDDSSVAVGAAAGVHNCPETGDGTVIFKSAAVPSADMTGLLYINKTVTMRGE